MLFIKLMTKKKKKTTTKDKYFSGKLDFILQLEDKVTEQIFLANDSRV